MQPDESHGVEAEDQEEGVVQVVLEEDLWA